MNKQIKIIISVILVIAVCVSSFIVPAASYSVDFESSTADMILINLDTDTTVFSQKPDNMWYAGYLAELMTYYVAEKNITNPKSVTFKVEKSFIDALTYSDGCLDKFVGETLTAYDLMAIMLLTSGSDAAYALADLSTDGDREEFVTQMNEAAEKLGCTNTGYISPGYTKSNNQYTTCRDLATLYIELLKSDLYKEIASNSSYKPENLEEETEGDYTVTTQASILNPNSPYYFRYAKSGKYSYTADTDASLVVTTTYRNISYLFVGLLGENEAENNVYADAKKLFSWCYTTLSDSKVINSEEVIAELTVNPGWGRYEVPLHTENSAFKTLPNVYDTALLKFDVKIPDEAKTPLLEGEVVGSAKLYYGDEEIDDVQLTVDTDMGVDMLMDTARFANYALSQLMPVEPEEEKEETDSETPSEPAQKAKSQPDDIGGI